MNKIELLVTDKNTNNGLVAFIKPKKPYIITHTLVKQIFDFQLKTIANYHTKNKESLEYIIWCFYPGKITIQGLDFEYIHRKLVNNEFHKVENYISQLFDVLFLNYIHLGLPIVNCAIFDRPFQSFAKEFVLMSQIIFIKNSVCDVARPLDDNMKKECVDAVFTHLHFSKELYKDKAIFLFKNRRMTEMSKILATHNAHYPDPEEQLRLKKYFEKERDKALARIKAIAAKNLNIFKRYSQLQKREYLSYKNK